MFSQTLEQQARQAFLLRNEFRTVARELMADRAAAEELYLTRPNLTWDAVIKKYSSDGLSGDALYQAIIDASQRTNPDVNSALGLGGAGH